MFVSFAFNVFKNYALLYFRDYKTDITQVVIILANKITYCLKAISVK